MEKVVAKNIPLSASFELTYACNIRCNICYQCPSEEKELTTGEIKTVLGQLVEAGCLYLSFTGGEPLLRPDFWQIAEYAKEKRFALILQTNGTLIDSWAADKLKALSFLQVHISIFGAKDFTHDKITQTAGSFNKAVNTAKLLIERGVTVIFKTTLMRENFAEYKEIKKLADALGAKPYFSPVIYPKTDKNKQPLAQRLSDEQLRELFSFIFARDKIQPEIYEFKKDAALCQMGRTDCCINPQGEVYPCVAVPIVVGSLKEKSFNQIWQGSDALRKLREISLSQIEGCAECELAGMCIKCLGMSLLEEKDLLSAPTECCRITKIIHKTHLPANVHH
ncbi:MAG: radical SAM protein [Candidatus Omnitrophota bacterium]